MKKGVLMTEVVAAARNGQITAVFPTALGWMALATNGNIIQELTFGNTTTDSPCVDRLAERLIERLQAYAKGRRVDFADFEIDTGSLSDFGLRVAIECRKIPYGKTLTYDQLAAKAGSPGAARAVGNRMAANRTPIIVPCHRVLPSGRGLGGFSAAGGVELKRRLLELETRDS